MASVKVKFRPSAIAAHEGHVYYQLIHDRKVRQIPSDYRIYSSEWDEYTGKNINPHGSDHSATTELLRMMIRQDVERIGRIIRRFQSNITGFSLDDVVCEYHRYMREYTLSGFMGSIIRRLKNNGKIRTSETYTAALRCFTRFYQCSLLSVYSKDMMIDRINAEIVEEFEAWQQKRGVVPNTISFYNRILRAVYNRAVRLGITADRTPFRNVYTGVAKTIKRALPLNMISKIKKLDLSDTPALDYSRDMFMMSFYLRGMSFIDMAFLEKSALRYGHISYRRHKTGQTLVIAWTREMQTIVDKYPDHNSSYLLPIIPPSAVNERNAYRNVSYNINRNLKIIASRTHINIPLTLYVARHSWASAARAKKIPLSVISEGLGHDSESTTQIYLASLDSSVIDRANALIIQSL